ncbi:MAG: hypothetical protein ACLQU1_01265 [Bryobacteraceae bacterium]|jgi:hypothetical protein
MFNYTVTIAVDPPGIFPPNQEATPSNGNFVYTPSLVRVSSGDTITWFCVNPFSLVFKEGTPVNEMEVFGRPGTLIPPGAPAGVSYYSAGPYNVCNVKGHFHYTVAVSLGAQVFLDSGCPDVSVN